MLAKQRKKKTKILADLTYTIFYWRVLCFFCGNVFLYHAKLPNRGLVACTTRVTQHATFFRQSFAMEESIMWTDNLGLTAAKDCLVLSAVLQ